MKRVIATCVLALLLPLSMAPSAKPPHAIIEHQVDAIPAPDPTPVPDAATHYVGPLPPPPTGQILGPDTDPGPDAPLDPQPELSWSTHYDFLHGVYFTRDPWGPALPVPPSARPKQWRNAIWSKGRVWLAVETQYAPPALRLCVRWFGTGDIVHDEECQLLPEGAARLAFAGHAMEWPLRQFAVKLYVLTPEQSLADADPIASVAFAGGGLASAAMIDGHPDNTPRFPWPAPRPTSKAPIDRELLVQPGQTLGDAANRLAAALELAGYDAGNLGYYSVPGGFALATRMEQIEQDGTPKPEPLRWSTALPPRQLFSLADFIHALFTAAEGHYRVIVFVVTAQAVETTAVAATESQAEDWLSGGLAQLPAEIARRPFADDVQCTALVYEFHKLASAQAPIANPDGAPSAVEQMQRTGITDALEH